MAGNLAYMCQRLYALVLIKEIGINEDNISNQNIYISVTKSETNILNHSEMFFKNKFHMTLDSHNRNLSYMYLFPNLHKNPSQCKFIFDATRCLVMLLPKDVTSALKFLHQQIESYNEINFYILEVETFWPMESKSN